MNYIIEKFRMSNELPRIEIWMAYRIIKSRILVS